MRISRVLGLSLLLAISGCEIEEGSFDGSFFDDDARVDEEDAGADDDDAGRAPRDAGRDAGNDAGRDSGTDSGMPALKPSDVPAVLARGLCGAAEKCIGKTLLLERLEGNDCVEFRTKQEADRHLHWLAKSIESNRVTFRPDRLEACERDLIALGCDAGNRRLPASCEDAVEGQSDVDENCAIDQDCKGNAWCDKGMLESCPGTCAEPQREGLPCQATRQCADGLICEDGNCTPPRSEGEACDTTMNQDCPFGLVCNGTMGAQTCKSIESVYAGALDASCDGFGQLCQVGLVCQSQSASSSMGKCVKPAALNGTCRRSQPAQCPTTQYCKDARTNVTARPGPGVDGVCADRPTDGEACVPNEECMPGTVCVGSMAKCLTRKSAGGECISNAQCYGGLCEEEICAITTIECP